MCQSIWRFTARASLIWLWSIYQVWLTLKLDNRLMSRSTSLSRQCGEDTSPTPMQSSCSPSRPQVTQRLARQSKSRLSMTLTGKVSELWLSSPRLTFDSLMSLLRCRKAVLASSVSVTGLKKSSSMESLLSKPKSLKLNSFSLSNSLSAWSLHRKVLTLWWIDWCHFSAKWSWTIALSSRANCKWSCES